MSSAWPLVALREVLSHRKEFIQINDLDKYKRCRVKLHAQGIVLRDAVTGSEIKTKKQQVCKAGEFLVAEIDAKVGGFGIVPDELNGSIVSSHYFLFEIDEATLDKRFLDFYSRTPAFRDQVAAQGSTNYAAIRPNDVLGYSIPLPSLGEQRRIVTRIEELAAKIEEARGLRRQAVEEAEALVLSSRNFCFSNLTKNVVPRRLDLIADSRLGKMLSDNRASDETGTPYIRNANVQWDRLDLTSVYRMTVSTEDIEKFRLESGDLLVCEGGDIGKSAIWNNEITGAIYQKALHRIRVDRNIIAPRFLLYHIYWASEQGHFSDIKTQTTIAHLTGVKLKAYPIYAPSLLEQHRIVTYLDNLNVKVDALKRLQSETTAELNAMLPSILDKAFKGNLNI